MKIEFNCCLCENQAKTSFQMPKDWKIKYDSIDQENCFCPDHALIKKWSDSQCPGCVGGWGDCGLWKAFAYREFKLTNVDLKSIEKGICPKRVNGSFSFNSDNAEFKELDLSEQADSEGGKVLVQALLDYKKKYHSDN